MAVPTLVLLVLSNALAAFASTHVFDWNITWVLANPDGAFERPVIGINGQWPLDVLNFTKGDRVIANVHNQLGNQTTSMHFHGLFQNGTTDMDGPPAVTQCEIPPESTFTYNFTVDQTGSYWYHSHSKGQYPDGLRQAFFVNDPEDPYIGKYDEEIVLTLSDWYHDQMPGLIKQFINVANPTGAEPVPNAALLNDTQNLTVAVQPGQTYLLRIVNVGSFAGQYFWIEGHSMKIVEIDGVWTDAAEADMIYLTVAQRYSVLVTTKNETDVNYAIVSSMDTDLFDTLPADLNYNVTGWLQYDQSSTLPQPALKDALEPYDDFNLVPVDGQEVLGPADYTVSLNLKMDNLGNGANYAFFNDMTYTAPKVPALYTAISTGELAVNPLIYGTDTNTYVLRKGDVVDIVVNNDDTGKHPFHLHGHNFQVLARSDDDVGHWNDSQVTDGFPKAPMRRDTLMVRPRGNFVIRFVADNPGVWFFHCHIYWHLVSGLAAVMIEAPLELQNQLVVPQDHYDACKAGGTPYAGNAAANTQDYLNLHGENRPVTPLPAGFTAGGIVAIVFSCVAAFLGLATISWYGAAPL